MPIPFAVRSVGVTAAEVPGSVPAALLNSSPARAVLLNLIATPSSVPVFPVCILESFTVAVPVKSKSHFAVAATSDSTVVVSCLFTVTPPAEVAVANVGFLSNFAVMVCEPTVPNGCL